MKPARRAAPQLKPRELVRRGRIGDEQADTATVAPDPYVDYSRYLTPEGGIAIIYKDIDERWRFVVRRFCLWGGATGAAAWLLPNHSPIHTPEINLALIVAVGIINWLIVRQPIDVYRTIEIRPDSMILEGRDIFWLRHMESWPEFGAGEDETQVLSGVYGTRRVEYLKVRAFDEFDSTPTVIASHLREAMKQLWSWPY